MDPASAVGLVASIITIVEVGLKTASALAEVTTTIKDAPQEISLCLTEISSCDHAAASRRCDRRESDVV